MADKQYLCRLGARRYITTPDMKTNREPYRRYKKVVRIIDNEMALSTRHIGRGNLCHTCSMLRNLNMKSSTISSHPRTLNFFLVYSPLPCHLNCSEKKMMINSQFQFANRVRSLSGHIITKSINSQNICFRSLQDEKRDKRFTSL